MTAAADRFKAALEAFIRKTMNVVDYYAIYACTVVTQNGDGTLELKPDLSKLGVGISNVPIWSPIAGTKMTVPNGARCGVQYVGGDPQQPIATWWDAASSAAITVSFGGGTAPLARMGDAVSVFFPPLIPITAAGLVGGVPTTLVGTLTIAQSAPGIITSGNKKFTA